MTESARSTTQAFEGCISAPLFGTPQDVASDPLHAVIAKRSKLWACGPSTPAYITYHFMDGTDIAKNKVRTTAAIWEQHAYVKFQEVEEMSASIRISFAGDGTWSYVGRDCLELRLAGKPTMNYSAVNGTKSTISTRERGDILHEFGHALGMLHEHQSPAKSGRKIDEEAIYHFYAQSGMGWDRDMIKSQIIDLELSDEVSNFSEVDTHSIMHYDLPGVVTGLTYDVPFNSELSETDKAYISLVYPNLNAPAEHGLAHALGVLKVGNSLKTAIMAFARRQTIDAVTSIREKLSQWGWEGWWKRNRSNPSYAQASLIIVPSSDSVSISAQVNAALCVSPLQLPSTEASPAAMVNRLWNISKRPDPIPDYKIVLKYDWLGESTEYQRSLVREAMDLWSRHASVEFKLVDQSPDLVIVFQTRQPDNSDYSYTWGGGRFTQQCSGEGDQPREKHSTCYRIFSSEDEANEWRDPKVLNSPNTEPRDGKACDMRSVLHELGHVLGLDHGCNGHFDFLPKAQSGVDSDTNQGPGTENPADESSTSSAPASEDPAPTECDFTSIMQAASADVVGYNSSHSSLEPPADIIIPVLYSLSVFDQANIALIYPGANLIDPSSNLKSKPYSCAMHGSESKISYYGQWLGLTDEDVRALEGYASQADWKGLREHYIAALNPVVEAAYRRQTAEVETRGMNRA